MTDILEDSLRAALHAIEELLTEAHGELDEGNLVEYEHILEKIVEQATAGIEASSSV